MTTITKQQCKNLVTKVAETILSNVSAEWEEGVTPADVNDSIEAAKETIREWLKTNKIKVV